MDHQQGFIEEVVRSGGVYKRDQVMNLYQTNPDLERYSDWSASWKTRHFKHIAAGMGYQVNPGRTGNRWQQKVNGEMKDFYELIRPLQHDAPQTQEGCSHSWQFALLDRRKRREGKQ